MNPEEFNIPLDDAINDFKAHVKNNQRIVFSARFGEGKTTFLRQYTEATKQEYYYITLHPVNYAVSQNEDIFEYIKRDILCQLHKDDYLDKFDFGAALDLFNWSMAREFISFLLTFVPGGKFYDKCISKFTELKEEYDQKSNTFSKYEDSFIQRQGNIYEHDGYTNIICEAINYIKAENLDNLKKTALIIEDLDRLDPAHIFRILNVLGAHIDYDSSSNKFGFDNIIVVMDYQTTESIFHHFYGPEANYRGYMSKFYSLYAYNYSINQVARQYLIKYIKEQCQLPDNMQGIYLRKNGMGYDLLSTEIQRLSVRDIQKILVDIDKQLNPHPIKIAGAGDVYLDAPIVHLLCVLKRMGIRVSLASLAEYFKNTNILVHMLGAFLFCHDFVAAGAPFRLSGVNYTLIPRIMDNVNQVCHSEIRVNETSVNNDIKFDIFLKALRFACSYVKDSDFED